MKLAFPPTLGQVPLLDLEQVSSPGSLTKKPACLPPVSKGTHICQPWALDP